MRPQLTILDVPVHGLTLDEAVDRIEAFIASGGPHHVVTVNPEFLVQARELPEFRRVLQQADLALADGVGLLVAARLLGRPLPGRVTGVDLVERLAERSAARGYRVYLLGAAPGVAQQTGDVLSRRYPGLQVVGAYAGSPDPGEDADLIARVRAAEPQILFVAFGAPQQDLWIRRNFERLLPPVAIGVGGAFDYISGRVPRAPRQMRALGLEWLYRLVRQPWRWRRMLRLPRFVGLVIRQRLQSTAGEK